MKHSENPIGTINFASADGFSIAAMPILLFIPAIVVTIAAVAYGAFTVKRRRMASRQRGFPVEPGSRDPQR